MVPGPMSRAVLIQTIKKASTTSKPDSKDLADLISLLESPENPADDDDLTMEHLVHVSATKFAQLLLSRDPFGEADLNALHKLIAHGLVSDGQVVRRLVAKIEGCLHGDFGKGSLLAAVKVLLVLGTSSAVVVGGGGGSSIVVPILECLLRIHRMGDVPAVTQAAARAAISQISTDRVNDKGCSDERRNIFAWACQSCCEHTNESPLRNPVGLLLGILQGILCRCMDHQSEPLSIDPWLFAVAMCRVLEDRSDLFPEWLMVLESSIELLLLLARGNVHLFCESIEMILYRLTTLGKSAELVGWLERLLTHSPQLLVDFYVNFDCRIGSEPIAQGILRLLTGDESGSRVLVAIVDGLLDWRERNAAASAQVELIDGIQEASLWRRNLETVIAAFKGSPASSSSPMRALRKAVSLAVLADLEPITISRWLQSTRGLDKRAIGDLLGEPGSEPVILALLQSHKVICKAEEAFGRAFCDRLEAFLQLFRLPGESQKISRILECFAHSLQGPPLDQDVLYKLAYSTIMLNTDLHSAQVRSKMDLASWIRNNRGIGKDGADLPRDLLEEIYKRVREREIRLAEDRVAYPVPLGMRRQAVLGDSEASGGWITAARPSHVVDLLGDPVELGRSFAQSPSERTLLVVERLIGVFEPEAFCSFIEAFLSKHAKQGLDESLILAWLYDLADKHATTLGPAWAPILAALSTQDRSRLHDLHHNLRQLDISRLDGPAVLSFLHALLGLPRRSAEAVNFIRHYGDRMAGLPAWLLERAIHVSADDEESTTVSLFTLLERCARDSLLASAGFRLLERCYREQMPSLLMGEDSRAKLLLEYLAAIVEYALLYEESSSPPHRMSSSGGGDDGDRSILAIHLLQEIGELASNLDTNRRIIDEEDPVSDNDFFLGSYPILSALTRVAIEHDSIVSSGTAITSLYALLGRQGPRYSMKQWRQIFRSLLLPILADLLAQRGNLAADLLAQTVRATVDLIVEMRRELVREAVGDVFSPLLRVMEDLLGRADDELARAGLFALHRLLAGCMGDLGEAGWSRVVQLLQLFLASTVPRELLEIEAEEDKGEKDEEIAKEEDSTKCDFRIVNFKLSLHLLVIQMIRDLCFPATDEDHHDAEDSINSILDPRLPIGPAHWETILESLGDSYTFASSFNQNMPVREALWRAGFLPNLENLVLVKQETSALSLSVAIRFRLFQQVLKGTRGWSAGTVAWFKMVIVVPLFEQSRLIVDRFVEWQAGPMAVPASSPSNTRPSVSSGTRKKTIKSWTLLTTLVMEQLALLYSTAPSSSPSCTNNTETPELYQTAQEALERLMERIFQDALQVYKLDHGGPSDAAHALLLQLFKNTFANT